MKRGAPLKRKTRLRAKGKSKYARRERDIPYMMRVKKMRCSVRVHCATTSRCQGRIEADHAGERPFGQKCPDSETIPMCQKHHRERTDLRGAFKGWSAQAMRVWCDFVIAETQKHIVMAVRLTSVMEIAADALRSDLPIAIVVGGGKKRTVHRG
jgi:hypothetical protein